MLLESHIVQFLQVLSILCHLPVSFGNRWLNVHKFMVTKIYKIYKKNIKKTFLRKRSEISFPSFVLIRWHADLVFFSLYVIKSATSCCHARRYQVFSSKTSIVIFIICYSTSEPKCIYIRI